MYHGGNQPSSWHGCRTLLDQWPLQLVGRLRRRKLLMLQLVHLQHMLFRPQQVWLLHRSQQVWVILLVLMLWLQPPRSPHQRLPESHWLARIELFQLPTSVCSCEVGCWTPSNVKQLNHDGLHVCKPYIWIHILVRRFVFSHSECLSVYSSSIEWKHIPRKTIWTLSIGSNISPYHLFSFTHPLEERLREAAKQQVRRLCQIKKKRTYLNPPEWLQDAFKTQDKTQMAQLLMDCNFCKDWVSQGFEIVI